MNAQIAVPQLCHAHQLETVQQLQIPPSGPWGATIVVINILLFQAATASSLVWDRCGKDEQGKADTSALSLVLAEIGCLGCFQPEKFAAALNLVGRKGLDEVARISRTSPLERAEDERV